MTDSARLWRKSLLLHLPRNHTIVLAQHQLVFQDDCGAWPHPRRCQLAGGGTLLETQLRTGVKDTS
jgi:hypothetical protein